MKKWFGVRSFPQSQVADLVDKLGRAVLQRDENLREKSKAQAIMWDTLVCHSNGTLM